VNGIELFHGDFKPFTVKPVHPIVSQNKKSVYYGAPSQRITNDFKGHRSSSFGLWIFLLKDI
jgi:hypothetical protein